MLSLCVVGCGGWTRKVMEHNPGITGDVELYFASRRAEKARQYCREYGGLICSLRTSIGLECGVNAL